MAAFNPYCLTKKTCKVTVSTYKWSIRPFDFDRELREMLVLGTASWVQETRPDPQFSLAYNGDVIDNVHRPGLQPMNGENCLFIQNDYVIPPGSLSLCSPAVSEAIALAGRSLSAGIDLGFHIGKTPKKAMVCLAFLLAGDNSYLTVKGDIIMPVKNCVDRRVKSILRDTHVLSGQGKLLWIGAKKWIRENEV